MQKILFSLPEELVNRMRIIIPARKRSKVVKELLEKEIQRREKELHRCALAVEKDKPLNREMADWDATVGDGIEPETW